MTTPLFDAAPRPRPALPVGLAVVYTRAGRPLRVPLPAEAPAPAEYRFMRWFRRQEAASPGFPVQVKSVLLVTGRPADPAGRRALLRFLDRYRLANRLRLIALPARRACGCRARCTCAFGRAPAAQPNAVLGETLLVGPYRRVRGHHIHQSGAYAPGGPAARRNPNHGAALAIAQGVPGFTRAQHSRASAVQRGTNRAAHGRAVDLRAGPVRVRATGTGRLPAAPSPGLEDLKAYYALLAAGKHPAEALHLVEQSARQLAAVGAVPVRVPTR